MSVKEIVPGWTASLKVAETGPRVETFVAPGAGVWAVTVGGGVFTLPGLKTTSTQ